jgi:hypothetical protein
MTTKLPLLPRRSGLLPGESLPSLLARLAKCNYYSPPTILNRLCLEGLEKDRLDRPLQAATYERLAALSGIDPAELHAATAHRFAQTLTPPDVEREFLELLPGRAFPLLGIQIASRQLRPEFAAQFCPDCLKEAAYHRLAWVPIAVSACVQHKRLLVNHCPVCLEKVAIRSVVETRCGRCGADLTEGRSVHVGDDELGLFAQQVIQSWLNVAPMPGAPWPYSLPDQPPGVLYRVLDGLRRYVMRINADWKLIHRPVGVEGLDTAPSQHVSVSRIMPGESYTWYVTAFKALINWPDGFFEFLQAYRLREGVKARGKLNKDLGTLYSGWLEGYWQHPAFEFVQDACDRYVLDNYAASPSAILSDRYARNPALAEKFPYLTAEEAARMLRTTHLTIRRLVQIGFLDGYDPPGYRSPRYMLVKRAQVLDLLRRWKAVSLEEIARQMGMPQGVIEGMARVRLLVVEHNPGVDGRHVWMFGRRNMERYLEVVQTHMKNRYTLPGIAAG